MNDELQVLKIVTQTLDEAKVPYMLSGSMALNFYAEPRMTRDIDIVIELSFQDVENFMKLFKEGEYYIEKGSIKRAITYEQMFGIIHNGYLVKVDFIIRKKSTYAREAFTRKQRVIMYDIPLWIISKEDLVIAKLIWVKESSSDLQTRDIRSLLKAVPNMDMNYIDHWLSELALSDTYHKVINA